MVETRCWVAFKNDLALQKKINDGWFTDERGFYLPISHFPGTPTNSYWPDALRKWAGGCGVTVAEVDDETYSAQVTSSQILDFIEFVYGSDSSYNDPAMMLTWKGRAYLVHPLIDLRAFVAKELDPKLLYELMTDTF